MVQVGVRDQNGGDAVQFIHVILNNLKGRNAFYGGFIHLHATVEEDSEPVDFQEEAALANVPGSTQ